MADPNDNTQAQILANVRNKALEEAALICENFDFNDRLPTEEPRSLPRYCATAIRALKTEEK